MINDLFRELDLLSEEAAQLDELLTTELGRTWSGTAYEACLMETRDNRENMLEAIRGFRSFLEENHSREIESETLPSDILL